MAHRPAVDTCRVQWTPHVCPPLTRRDLQVHVGGGSSLPASVHGGSSHNARRLRTMNWPLGALADGSTPLRVRRCDQRRIGHLAVSATAAACGRSHGDVSYRSARDLELATWPFRLLTSNRPSGRAHGSGGRSAKWPIGGSRRTRCRCGVSVRRARGNEFATSDTRATLLVTTERRWSDCTNHVEVAVARGAPSTRSRSSEGDQRAPCKTTAATVRPRSGPRIPSGAVPV